MGLFKNQYDVRKRFAEPLPSWIKVVLAISTVLLVSAVVGEHWARIVSLFK
jgi:hypothetical protein